MEALSDETLVRIFACLPTGDPLLDAVPRVCKRWRDLSRDPRAWAGVFVWGRGYCADPALKETPPVDARALLRGPAMHRLNIGSQWDRWMVSALARSRAVVLDKVTCIFPLPSPPPSTPSSQRPRSGFTFLQLPTYQSLGDFLDLKYLEFHKVI